MLAVFSLPVIEVCWVTRGFFIGILFLFTHFPGVSVFISSLIQKTNSMFVPPFVAASGLTGERAWLGQCGPLVSFWGDLGLCSWLSAVCWLLFAFLVWFCLFVCGMFGGN